MAEELNVEFVRAIYRFTGGDQAAVPLLFAESTILQVVEKTQEGWCRGFAAGKEGWFPISYVKPLGNGELLQKGIQPSSLAALMRSDLWTAHITNENKIYYVNTENKGTTWELPTVQVPVSPTTGIPSNPAPLQAAMNRQSSAPKLKTQKSKKPKQIVVNGITYVENGEEQPLLEPTAVSYVDHFWADKGDQSGFDVILAKHLNGKECMKDMIDFFRERAALEEQYAKGLLKLSKSTLADQEEGTLGKAWQALKAECRHRSNSHMKFVEQLQKDIEKPLFEYKESQKKARKEHQQIMEKSRKQVTSLDTSIDKALAVIAGKGKTKKSNGGDILSQPKKKGSLTGEEIKKLQESYNIAQQQWKENMISACQDFERHEAERSDCLQKHLLQYIDLCVAVDEDSAESLSLVTDAIDRIKTKADREYFIKLNGTGIKRPVERTFDQ